MTVLALVLAVIGLAVAVLALRRADVVERRARAWAAAPSGDPGQPASPSGLPTAQVEALEQRIGQLERTPAISALRRVAVVRYDAFEDVGGRLSFSAAVVDDRGRGIVLTAIHGRSETRSYLKTVPVTADSGQRELSPEENQAVASAMRGAGP